MQLNDLIKKLIDKFNIVELCYRMNKNFDNSDGFKFIREGNTDTEVIYKENGKELVICFRGVDRLFDLFFCFQFSKIKIRGVKIHKGFFSKFFSILLEIKKVIDINKFDKYTVIGYSLGSAIARLFVWYLYLKKEEYENRGYDFKKEIDLYIFGSPRLGDKEFEGCLNKITNDYINYTYNFDFVTHLPPKIFRFSESGKNRIKIKYKKRRILGHWGYDIIKRINSNDLRVEEV